jgi:hypothetical protein
MTAKKKTKGIPTAEARRTAEEAGGGALGAAAGAMIGAVGGPAGAVVGAILGGVAGAMGGAAMDTEAARVSENDEKLDAEIGVSGGEMGAPNLKHPPAKVGAYSSASAGGGARTSNAPANGPMQSPDDEDA